ncbi:MAG: prephenate dehydrogenase [Anaerovoracaceae bacterium]|jgi:prephenate dehydrogenase
MRIIVVGIGLIGGSFCKAIKAYTDHHVIGMDKDDTSLDLAISMEAVDEVIPMDRTDLLSRGDLVIVAIPPNDIIKFLLTNKDKFKKGAIVADVCGVKQFIVSQVQEPLREAGVEFIGSHPMAGTEYAGFVFSKPDMFVNASYLMTPDEKTDREKVNILKKFAYSIGFKKVIETDPETHDQAIAYTSQLAHIISNSYIRSSTLPKEKGFSAGSFLDMTRVARLDENMWSDLFICNKKNLLNEIDQLQEHISDLRDALAAEDKQRLMQLLHKGRMLKQQNVAEKKMLLAEEDADDGFAN